MSAETVSQSYLLKVFKRFEVLLPMTSTLLLAATLVFQVLADLDPPLTIQMKKLYEFDSLLERPKVWLTS